MKLCIDKNKDDRMTCPAVGLISILIFVILSILIYEIVVVRLLQTISGS
ncbi:hypothetical protein [Methanococcoides methylutens]|nr:hypothetical protein [Methanococcoides methylutens]